MKMEVGKIRMMNYEYDEGCWGRDGMTVKMKGAENDGDLPGDEQGG